MLVRHWMTKDVFTVTPETSMLKANKLMKEHRIGRLPVVDGDGRVVGIVSDRDIRSASPSQATTLDMYEIYYLLSEVRIKDIMTANPLTIDQHETVESAAMILEEKGFGGLPVVDAQGNLVGIITSSDLFKVLLNITGARKGGVQMGFSVPDRKGGMRAIFDTLREAGASIVSVLSSSDDTSEGMRNVYVRIRPMDRAAEDALVEKLKQEYNLLYWARNHMHLV